jgi:hypothetical protein
MPATSGSARARAVVILALVISSNTLAWAQPKTDVVRLANGDHVTGEIVHLERGRLRLKTDDAGTIDFEWDNIAGVESTRQFEIGTTDGLRILGSLQPAVGRSIHLVGNGGDVMLSMNGITTIYPIGSSFLSKLDGSVNMGYSYTRSSAIGQLSVNTDTTFRRPAFLFKLSMSGTWTEQPGDEKDDRGNLQAEYLRYRGRWFAGGGVVFENNESLGLVLRSQGGGIVGQRLVNTNRAQLEVGGGLVGNNEEAVDSPSTKNLEAVGTIRWSFFTYDGSKTNLATSFDYYPSLSNWGRQRLQFDFSFSRDVWKDFAFAIDVFDTFDSAPPDPAAAHNDVGVVTSIGWTY